MDFYPKHLLSHHCTLSLCRRAASRHLCRLSAHRVFDIGTMRKILIVGGCGYSVYIALLSNILRYLISVLAFLPPYHTVCALNVPIFWWSDTNNRI
ncbi:hypothetical protein CPB85DRAFT_1318448, partial [Mucidula mucida]